MNPTHPVLVIEPDPALRRSLVEILVSDGYAVSAAADVDQARALLKAEALPGLIVVGTQGPFMPGFRERFGLARELARTLRVVVISDEPPTGVISIRKEYLVQDLLAAARRYCRQPAA
jgi:DNA-binding response OmpR family regulator